jgi:hypothetical protein
VIYPLAFISKILVSLNVKDLISLSPISEILISPMCVPTAIFSSIATLKGSITGSSGTLSILIVTFVSLESPALLSKNTVRLYSFASFS